MRAFAPRAAVVTALLAVGLWQGIAAFAASRSDGDPQAGKSVFAEAGCGSCHTLKDAGASGSIGPDLDRLKPPADRVIRQVENGGGSMPAFAGRLSAKQIHDVAAYVVAATSGTGAGTEPTPTPTPTPAPAPAGPVEELVASLDVKQEVPTPDVVGAGGSGRFTGVLRTSGAVRTLEWELRVRGLTGRAVAAHVHVGAAGKAGPVAVPLCSPCGSRERGEVRVDARARRALLNGTAYVNVHTQRNEAGEIRGQVGVKTG